MKMTVELFFEIFLEELKDNSVLQTYYRFLSNPKSYNFRKAYFVQRLQYVYDQIQNKEAVIWDLGCGYGTTCLFLAMNGIKTKGTTIEFYYEQIEKRKAFWKKHGNVDLFEVDYENLFDNQPTPNSIDYIILQDTLHHLEPLSEAMQIIQYTLNTNGKILLIDENGNNIFQWFKLFLRRGNKRIIKIWDEKLKKHILLGNENIRSLKKWKLEASKNNLLIDENATNYIRFYPPFLFGEIDKTIKSENKISKKCSFLKEYFFFGINFVMVKK